MDGRYERLHAPSRYSTIVRSKIVVGLRGLEKKKVVGFDKSCSYGLDNFAKEAGDDGMTNCGDRDNGNVGVRGVTSSCVVGNISKMSGELQPDVIHC